MTKYVLAYHSGGGGMPETAEEQEELMKVWAPGLARSAKISSTAATRSALRPPSLPMARRVTAARWAATASSTPLPSRRP